MPTSDDAEPTIPPNPSGKSSKPRDLDVTADSSQGDAASRATQLDSRSWAGDSLVPDSKSGIPTISSRYQILTKLGEGGFGVVYLANQTEPIRRKVALKVMKMAFATPTMLVRFAAEQQSLAIMDHPGLAKFFDAGTNPDGQPYFAMEYAPGEPLGHFCDNRKLDIRTRIELLAQVCDAVQHAHMKGVVHRDLKPGNLLVSETEEGFRTKVIDFGIAKVVSGAAGENVMETQFGQFVGTPVYMSPEQAEGGTIDIDTRSDIYALGVILYELLVGSTPIESETIRKSGIAHLHRTIMDFDPPRPSVRLAKATPETRAAITSARRIEYGSLERQLKRDLDWITMRCLEKDRTRRYESASGLAADLRRFLDGEPVLAGPPGTRYRLEKFVRRNRLAVGSSAVAAVALVAFSVVMFVLWSDAIRQNDRAMRTLDVFLSSLKSSNVSSGAQLGTTVTVGDFLKLVEKEAAEKLATQPDIANDVRETIGPVFTSLTDYESAARTMMPAVEYRRQRAQGGDETDQVALANALHEFARALYWIGRTQESRTAYEEALELRRTHLSPLDPSTAQTMTHLSAVYCDLNELALSDKLGDESVTLMRKIDTERGEELSRTLFSRATTLLKAKRYDDAWRYADESAGVLVKKFGAQDWRLGRSLALLANIELARDRPELALVHQRKAVELILPRYGSKHPTVTASWQKLAETLFLLSTGSKMPTPDAQVKDLTQFEEAMLNLQLAIEGRRNDGTSPLLLAASLESLARGTEVKGDLDGALVIERQIASLLLDRAPQAAEQISAGQARTAALERKAALRSAAAPSAKPSASLTTTP